MVEARNASSAASASESWNSPSTTSRSSRSSSISAWRVIESRIPDPRAGVCSSPPLTQKMVEVGASRTTPSGRTNSASSAPARPRDPGRLHVGRVGERLDPGQDHARRVGHRGEADRRAPVAERLDQRDPAPAAGDQQPELGVGVAVSLEQSADLALERRAVEVELDRSRPSARAGRGARRARTDGRSRAGSPRTPRRPGRGRRRAVGSSPSAVGTIAPSIDASSVTDIAARLSRRARRRRRPGPRATRRRDGGVWWPRWTSSWSLSRWSD